MVLTITVGVILKVRKRFLSDGWHQSVSRVTSIMSLPMWSVIPCTFNSCFSLYHTVGIRCDSMGDIHLWENPICWNSSNESPEVITKRPETGETRQ